MFLFPWNENRFRERLLELFEIYDYKNNRIEKIKRIVNCGGDATDDSFILFTDFIIDFLIDLKKKENKNKRRKYGEKRVR